MSKFFKAVGGLIQTLFYVKVFSPKKIFKDKRVVIIGAANSIFEEENGKFIDSFDYVIRINKALTSWDTNNDSYTGTRADILFHSFYENTDRGGGGPLDFKVFKTFNVKFVIQPRNNREGWRVMFNFFKKYNKARHIFTLPKKYYQTLSTIYQPLKPTMGFCALHAVLNSSCKEVFITGFTFFKTPYASGYRDHLLDMKANEDHIKKQGQHDPNLEYFEFKKLLMQTHVQTILVDGSLYSILKEDGAVPSSVKVKRKAE